MFGSKIDTDSGPDNIIFFDISTPRPRTNNIKTFNFDNFII